MLWISFKCIVTQMKDLPIVNGKEQCSTCILHTKCTICFVRLDLSLERLVEIYIHSTVIVYLLFPLIYDFL